MKKVFYSAVGAVIISATLVSCTRCDVCSKEKERNISVCENHYGSHHDYDKVLEAYKDLGYKCNHR
jgi:hypothetical protein